MANLSILLLVTLTLHYSSGQESLRAIQLTQKLTYPLTRSNAVYDGADSIYLVGGSNFDGIPRGILRFDIAFETITYLDRFPIGRYDAGTAHFDNAGDIFYFGGAYQNETGSSLVYKYSVKENLSYSVAEFPYAVSYSGSVSRGNKVVIIGWVGSIEGLLHFDMDTHTYINNGSLITGSYTLYATGMGSKAYVFGFQTSDVKAVELDLDTMQSIHVGSSDFPRLWDYCEVINDGRHIYIVGGDQNNPTSILKFNPNTYSHKIIPVVAMLYEGHYFHDAPAAVYVKKMNRIYLFGGRICRISGGMCETLHSIQYIDL